MLKVKLWKSYSIYTKELSNSHRVITQSPEELFGLNEASDERLNKIQEKALFVSITCLETLECLNSEFFHLSFINVHLPIGLLFTTLKNSLKHDTLAGLWVPHSRGAMKIQLVRSGFYYSAWRRVINNSFVQAYYLLAVFC